MLAIILRFDHKGPHMKAQYPNGGPLPFWFLPTIGFAFCPTASHPALYCPSKSGLHFVCVKVWWVSVSTISGGAQNRRKTGDHRKSRFYRWWPPSTYGETGNLGALANLASRPNLGHALNRGIWMHCQTLNKRLESGRAIESGSKVTLK